MIVQMSSVKKGLKTSTELWGIGTVGLTGYTMGAMSIGDRVLLQLPGEAVGEATRVRRACTGTRAGRDCLETSVVGGVGS